MSLSDGRNTRTADNACERLAGGPIVVAKLFMKAVEKTSIHFSSFNVEKAVKCE
jgi:hypothetical protein